jgi:HD-GYP domain-containing protein (c-di-GMP phosphodiesterase class II)
MEYIQIDIKDVIDLHESPCDVFLFLPGGKKVTICRKGNDVNRELLDKYSQNENVEIKVLKSDYSNVAQKKLEEKANKIAESLRDKQFINRKRRINVELSSFALSRAILSTTGISETSMDLADESYCSILYTLEKVPTLKMILSELDKKGEFFVTKSLIMNYLCIYVLGKTKWNDENSRKNLSLACILHDYTLKDKKVVTEKAEDLDQKLQKIRDSHAELEAKELEKHHAIPLEVINIIKFHHHFLDGSGARLSSSIKLNYYSQIFNIAHQLAVEILEKGANKNTLTGFFYNLSQKTDERFKPIVDSFSYIL